MKQREEAVSFSCLYSFLVLTTMNNETNSFLVYYKRLYHAASIALLLHPYLAVLKPNNLSQIKTTEGGKIGVWKMSPVCETSIW
jgi:hypothetical protein